MIAFIFITAAIGGFGQAILTSEQDREEFYNSELPRGDGPEAPAGDAAHYLQLLILPDSVTNFNEWVFGADTYFPISPWYSAATTGTVIVGAFGIMVFRYRKLGA